MKLFTKSLLLTLFCLALFIGTSPLYAQPYNVTSAQQCSPTTGGVEIVTFNNVPPNANGDATLVITYRGDLNSGGEVIDFFGDDGIQLGTSNLIPAQCTGIDSSTYTIPMMTLINWASDGTISITADAATSVNSGLTGCINGSSFCVTVRLEYPVTTAPNDVGVAALDSPGVFCAGSQNLYATIANYGTNQVNNFTVNWSFNGNLETPISLSTPLDTVNGAGNSTTQVFLGNKTINDKDTVKIWTSNPNGALDTVNVNDTLERIITPSLNGVITVGPGGGTDYSSFGALILDLNEVGVCGPVNVNVQPGTYNEFLDMGPIVGASSTNQIVFDGGDTSLVTLSHDGLNQNAAIKLAGAEWVTFKKMKIENTSSAIGSWGVLLMMGADHNTIDSCLIDMPLTTNFDVAGINASSNEANDFGEGNNANFTTVSNSVIRGGERNITFEGGGTGQWNVGNQFINNVLEFADDFGFYGDDQDSLVFQGNTIRNIQQTVNGDGFYSFDFENLTLRENIIEAPDWAVYCADLNVDGIGGRSVIANNFVTSPSDYGIYVIDGENIDIYHNTIFGEPALYLDYSSDGLDSIDVRNNIFISNADNAFEIDLNLGFVGVSNLDNNIYETNGTAFVVWEGQPYADLAQWIANIPQYNANSFEGDPIFSAPGDFHVVGPLANNQGAPVGITIDLDGDPRSATIPDIGADEYALVPNDAGVVSIDSPTVFCPGTFDVWATLANFGTNQITSATVNWSVDGIPQTSASFSGLLDTLGGTGSRFGQVLLGSFNFATNNPYAIDAWTTNPNGVVDINTTNDSLLEAIQSNLPPPTNIGTTQLSATQATLSWTGGSANTWLWVNVPAGTPLVGSGTPVSSASATVTGLVTETGYDFYVREVCATGDTSLWAGPFFYITPFQCPPNAFCLLTGGATGQFGPTQSQLNTIYNGTNLSGQVTSNAGIQTWTVPNGGLYNIEIYGAQGGGANGGRGAKMSGDFLLNSGDVLEMIVGQQGTENDNGTGGGGGTFIVSNSNPLIIAGGGGGNNGTVNTQNDGQTGQNGQDGLGTSGFGLGGVAGNAGGSEDRGQGGAGWLQDGPPLTQTTTDVPAERFLNGGEGGYHTTSPGGLGGFGGGGGSWNTGFRGSGGGGGYSGGGAGYVTSNNTNHSGGGAGSFNAGTNQSNVAGSRFGDGVIIIRTLSSGAPNDIGIVGIDSPRVFCPGIQDVWVSVNNFGTTQVTSASINWTVDGVAQTPVSFSGLLDTIGGTGQTTDQLLLGSFNFGTNNPYDVKVWTSLPNGLIDTVAQNDTINRIIQSNLPPPDGLAFSNLFATQVDINWNPGALANSWLWINVPAGTPPSGIGTASSGASTTVSGLTQNTNYDFYVREVCAGGGDTSAWAGPLSYITPCAIYFAPFFEDFDGAQWSLTTPFDIDACWNRTTSTAPFWRTEDLNTGSGSTGPAGDLSGIGKYVYMETSGGTANQTSELESPPIDISGLSAPQVEFWYHMYGATMGTLNLDVLDSAGNWVNIWTLVGQQQTSSADPWINVAVPFSPSTDTIQIRFQGIRGTSFTGDMSVDEVRVRDAPNNDLALNSVTGLQTACGLTSNESFTVEVENKGAITQSNFDIEYSVNNGPFILGQNVTTPLAFAQVQSYTITGVDLSGPGQKCIDVRVVLLNDEDTANNVVPQICIFNQAVPTIDSVVNGEVCNGGVVNMEVFFSSGATLNWYDDPALTNLVNTGGTFSPNLSATTTYYVEAVNTNGCKSPAQTVIGEVNFTPTVNFNATPTNCTVVFTGVVSNNADSVRWDFGDPAGGTSTALNPTYTYNATLSYLVTLTAYDGTCANDTVKAVFVNCQPIALSDGDWNSSINMYPNPTQDEVTITIPDVSDEVFIRIVDIAGQTVGEFRYDSQSNFQRTLMLDELDDGVYFVNITSGDKTAVKKLTKQ